ncbi:hypothetical protein EJ05DRAFT_473837 [Pseudovirgaria hyperparasitica]|uniref:Thioesterase domain-containing protein n=1 Tax=Pseudovirgaria hyperparasitica TaxID=470096 RepID=A0A6A6WF13_9PEZI|nr:uncharacterized protein EJ05DRAFT_473837 [Pseudovirgaria hyperparasitica]KAF2761313.1 hypothetical protein EJ05DRAFT_473837 [Pseudovirgaria hyperparasitica]
MPTKPTTITTTSPFTAHPWCTTLLRNPSYTLRPAQHTLPTRAPTEDTFFAHTLSTPTTISSLVCLYKNPPVRNTKNTKNTTPTTPTTPQSPQSPEARWLLALQSHLNGYPDTAHGGLIATILDEITGYLINVNADLREARAAAAAAGAAAGVRTAQEAGEIEEIEGKEGKEEEEDEDEAARGFYTAYLNVRYRAQLKTPGVYMAVARYERVDEARGKVWLRAEIVDGGGRVYADAEALYVRPRAKM